MSLIELRNVTKKFGGLTAVNNLSFLLEERQILGLIGPNGAGKSTVFSVMTGFYPIDKGEILFQGETWRTGLLTRSAGSDWSAPSSRPGFCQAFPPWKTSRWGLFVAMETNGKPAGRRRRFWTGSDC